MSEAAQPTTRRTAKKPNGSAIPAATPEVSTKTAAKPKHRPNPFLQNFDHLEDIAMRYLQAFIESIDIKDDKELAFRVMQVLEETLIKNLPKTVAANGHANGKSNGIDLSTLSEEEQAELDDEDLAKIEAAHKAAQPKNTAQDDDEDEEKFDGLEKTFPHALAAHLASGKPIETYKPRYKKPSYPIRIDTKDWNAVKAYFANTVEIQPKRGKGVRRGSNPQHENLMSLADMLEVSDKEKQLLELLVCGHHTTRLQHFLYDITGAMTIHGGRNPMRQCIARALGITPRELNEMLKVDAPLRKKHLLEDEDPDSPERSFGLPAIDDTILDLIDQPDITRDQMISHILGKPVTTKRKWSDFEGIGPEWAMLKRYIEGCIREGKGANILVAGSVGIGKSDLFKALCQELGIPLYIPGNDADNNYTYDGRPLSATRVRFDAWRHGITLFSAAQGRTKRQHCAMFLEEAGDLLKSGNDRQTDGAYGGGNISRLHFHDTIETSPVITFYATNDDKWDAGFLSRMDFGFVLGVPNGDYANKIWHTVIKETGMQKAFSDADIDKLATELEIPPRLMKKAVEFAKTIDGGLPEALFYIENMAELLYGGIDNVRTRQPEITPLYTDLLKFEDEDMDAKTLMARISHAKDKPVTLLVSGPDGTGKKHIAAEFAKATGRRMRTVTFEQVMGKSYADTQTNVRMMFELAVKDRVALHLHGFDLAINPAVLAQNPSLAMASEHLADALSQSPVPVIMTTRNEGRTEITGELLKAFSTHARLGYADDTITAAAIERFSGRKIPVTLNNRDVTVGDIRQALRNLDVHGLPDSALGKELEKLSVRSGSKGLSHSIL